MQQKNERSIVFFTKYGQAGASSRYRSFQYFPFYKEAGYNIISRPLIPDSYIYDFYRTGKKPILKLIVPYLKRFMQLLFLKKTGLIYIEYELFPYLPLFIERWLLKGKKNIIIDYDDAIFHNYDKSTNRLVRWLLADKIYKLAGHAKVVITGSPYLTGMLRKHTRRIVEIPASILFEKYNTNYKPLSDHNKEVFRIGWIGSKTTSINISLITVALKAAQNRLNTELVLVGFDPQQQHLLSGLRHVLYEWDDHSEVELIRTFDAGIMPLLDNDFNKGKCGFKLIQYMACGKPTISTPLPANKKINGNNNNLFAETSEEWITAFEELIRNRDFYQQVVGVKNKERVANHYSVESNLCHYLAVFKSLTG